MACSVILGSCSASRESCQYFLNGSSGEGNAVIIVVGGMREIYLAEYQTMIFYLKKRKGFIRLALQNGLVNIQSEWIGKRNVFLLLVHH